MRTLIAFFAARSRKSVRLSAAEMSALIEAAGDVSRRRDRELHSAVQRLREARAAKYKSVSWLSG